MIKQTYKAWAIELVHRSSGISWPCLGLDPGTGLPRLFRTKKAAKEYLKSGTCGNDKYWKFEIRRVNVTTESI